MQSLKSAARRGAIISVTAVSALALASCSAGHVTQTAEKVAAVDGASASTEDNKAAVRDVTILVEPDGTAALKFSAINQGYDTDVISLESVKVDGQRVEMDKAQPLHRDQSIIADSQKNLDATPQQDSENVQYIATTLKNDDFGYAGDRPARRVPRHQGRQQRADQIGRLPPAARRHHQRHHGPGREPVRHGVRHRPGRWHAR